MTQALTLLLMAMQLLTVVNHPGVPDTLKQSAISIANNAIQVANDVLKNAPAKVQEEKKISERSAHINFSKTSEFATDFKIFYKVGTSTISFIADGYRDNESPRGWFKWWTVRNSDSQTIISQITNAQRLLQLNTNIIESLQFQAEIPLTELSPYDTRGYTQHYYQFCFQRTIVFNSCTEPQEFQASGY